MPVSTTDAPTSQPGPGQVPLSCYIRTLNEAERVGPVITQALKVASEVVVVDSGSTDATVTIAESAGARVIDNAWPGNGHQKRVGEEACHHDWLLDLDADEVITDDLAHEIRALFAAGRPNSTVYALPMAIKVPTAPAWTSFFITHRNKLYDRRAWRMPAHAAWDQLDLPKTEKPPRLNNLIIHYSFTDFAQLVRKMNSVSSTRAKYTKPRSKWHLRVRIFSALPIYLLKHYIARGLWRGGTYGFATALQFAHARWLRDVKMYEALVVAEQDRTSASASTPTSPEAAPHERKTTAAPRDQARTL
ncbi:MAG: glycosyltransferase family 2 protein [Pseudomonadota bacterium]